MRNSKKIIALVAAIAIICTTAIVGTIAYLRTETEQKVNTFTVGNVDISLTETTGSEYKMIPGTKLDKDPKVTVDTNSENCYLFVKVVEGNNTANSNVPFILYDMASGWTKYKDTDVYYKAIVNANQKNVAYSVLASEDENDKVLVNPNLVKNDMDVLQTSNTLPTLTIKTCAVQQDNLTLEAAFGEVPSDF